ncbi:hypothetical protein SOASR030_12610 [Leminorella grimontii]|uniref:Tetratricopeptide repeat protein n=1 Tax=Leminorella grimontii TaxID=82981 RepID=A0AAV5N0I1_9GAMM|nr:tetratricopeptide repeat protein [Leminorella grimontii]KFC97490.1 hypothetical protein GLGR_0425 [Leminorella grimontii ATCC 33999 = DSM 5078]GKX55149.1 hypothetical protein SOASR030_12610 [Leminorella grimontii]VFS56829.1 Predicted ATPase [Leminorella grimontii]
MNAKWLIKLFALPLTLFMGSTGAQETNGTALAELKEIYELVMDPNQMFSISKTLGRLEIIEPTIQTHDTAALGKLLFLRSFVQSKANRDEEALSVGLEALKIDDQTPFLSDEDKEILIHWLTESAKNEGNWQTAVELYERRLPLAGKYDEGQRLGLRSEMAYCLHEAGRYDDARAQNEDILTQGETLYGQGSERLLSVITNLAQNFYMLKQYDRAQALLERRLAIAKAHNEEWDIDDSLFQLGVLAFEQGQNAQAESLMKQRLALAKESGDADRMMDAEEALQILYEKMGQR